MPRVFEARDDDEVGRRARDGDIDDVSRLLLGPESVGSTGTSVGGAHRRRGLTAVAWCVLGAAMLVGVARASGPTFAPGPSSPVAVGTNPHSIAAADLNGDRKTDLAVANFGSNTVSLLMGTGLGGFGTAVSVPVGDGPLGVAAADLNRDGRTDLAVANSGSDAVSVLLANRGGGFTAAPPVMVSDSPWYIAVGDLNRDGKADLAVSHAGFSPDASMRVSILLGDGTGGFSHAAGSPLTVGRIPYGIAIADLNRDRKPDLAVANQFSATVSILLGNGDGTFASAPGAPVPVGSGPSWVAAADLNRDRKLDLAVANQGSDTVSILLGNGAGGFVATGPVPAGDGPTALEVADLDRDRTLDLVVSNIFSDNVSVLLGTGTGRFAPAAGSPLAVGDMPFALAVATLDPKRAPDLAVANYGSSNVTVWLNTTPSDEDA